MLYGTVHLSKVISELPYYLANVHMYSILFDFLFSKINDNATF